jgi:hypothetical protein
MSYSNTQNRFRSTTQGVAETSKEFVEQHAISTTTAAFALGFGIGIALAMALFDRRSRSESGMAHRLGRQVMEAMSSVMPENLTNFRR